MTGSDEKRILELRNRLRDELNELYFGAEADGDRAKRSEDCYIDGKDNERPLAAQRIAQILRAFNDIESGEYGRCTNCGEPIETSRLEADVVVNTCEACSTITYR